MKNRTKLTHGEQQSSAAEHTSQQGTAREFADVEALLRHDAARTEVPPAIAVRLQKELAELPPPKMSWWQRWFGGAGS